MTFPLRPIGKTDILVTPIAMGCWPISGITSLDVTEANSLATLRAAVDSGINFFDTAFSYGFAGESESMIAEACATADKAEGVAAFLAKRPPEWRSA